MTNIHTWPRCPEAADFFEQQYLAFARSNPILENIAYRFLSEAGVNILALIEHWTLPPSEALIDQLQRMGLHEKETVDGDRVWEHPTARLPRVQLVPNIMQPRISLAIEDVAFFLHVHGLHPKTYSGNIDSPYEEAICEMPHCELKVVARRAYQGFRTSMLSDADLKNIRDIRKAFSERNRSGSDDQIINRLQKLAEQAVEKIGAVRAADEFFAAERAFYMTRNTAARWQYERQQALGLGWANHDHHTYRSSRLSFRALMKLWQTFGFEPRERFYAGEEAGWGAQIFEHPESRVIIFADVDMAPEELEIDYLQTDLPPRNMLGTIGLWCGLHGDSIGAAGMHHLECEFDFERVQQEFQQARFMVMAPFTDLPMLKQAFTQAEQWSVPETRLAALAQKKLITPEQSEKFQRYGAAGSHLEILQRWEGFKGFNKTGVSAIIRATDARLQAA